MKHLIYKSICLSCVQVIVSFFFFDLSNWSQLVANKMNYKGKHQCASKIPQFPLHIRLHPENSALSLWGESRTRTRV